MLLYKNISIIHIHIENNIYVILDYFQVFLLIE